MSSLIGFVPNEVPALTNHKPRQLALGASRYPATAPVELTNHCWRAGNGVVVT